MAVLSAEELEVAQLIVETLHLEDLDAQDIDPQTPLFREGLGLDSIDALELSLGIKQKYGIQLKADDANIADIFTSVKTLSKYIQAHK